MKSLSLIALLAACGSASAFEGKVRYRDVQKTQCVNGICQTVTETVAFVESSNETLPTPMPMTAATKSEPIIRRTPIRTLWSERPRVLGRLLFRFFGGRS